MKTAYIYAYTASFCVENARELGIPAALLLDKIVKLCKCTTRQDGFCWYTARQFEEDTSLKKDAFDRAAHLLEERGIVERKVTYIIGTMRVASHFKLTPVDDSTGNNLEVAQTHNHGSGLNPLSVNTTNNTTNMCSAYASPADAGSAQAAQSSSANASSDVHSSLPDSSSANASSSSESSRMKKNPNSSIDEKEQPPVVRPVNCSLVEDTPKERGASTSDFTSVEGPFVTEVDGSSFVDVAGKKNQKNKQAVAVLTEVAEILGRDKRQINSPVIKNMKAVLDEYSYDEVIQMAEWVKGQEFWRDKTLLQMIKKDTVAQALMNKRKDKYAW